ncbi:type II toxin-antitoxin system ParD family antitoxin [Pararhizobium sp. YC-54]|uniref:type II toxin-antitoxin system ParD family antitoxin n=1 Tax=Pararhizobium sp. YC-54 TaxID=2986920 RepID=UPI0021F706A6|nr:type II toxin-antitoxin system ParD family antitoxin [Pararhizobium sp. YC-54]MCV9997597.1 type II toxin-antitoxin system ParD family antitoxin [Pararhizobium sp. YC-54]
MSDIQLSEEDRAFIEERVRSGPYKSANDVVHAGLRSLQRDEAALKILIQEGLDDIAAGRFYEFGEEDNLTEFIMDRSKARNT